MAPMDRRAPLALALALGALAVGGCGSKAGSTPASATFSAPEQQAVSATIKDIADASGGRDYAKICSDYLAAPLVKRFDGAKGTSGCADALEQSLRDVDQSKLAVRTIRVQGTNAEAIVQPTGTGQVEKPARLALVKEGPRWKLSGIR
jgi:hypothetical protein